MSSIILIHGAWHTGSCWDDVSRILKENGHNVFCITLPGNGPNDNKNVTYQSYIDHVYQVISDYKEKVIIVGHSSAGHVIQMSIPKIADRIEKIIFNNAWILADGLSQFDLIPDDIKSTMRTGAKGSGTNSIPVDAAFVKHSLATNASPEILQKLLSKLVPQPIVLFEEPIKASAFAKLSIPLVLLHNKKDTSLPPGAYIGMYKSLGDNPVIEIDCDHEGLFTNPNLFTEGLLRCIEL